MVKINTCTQTTGCNEDIEDTFNPKKRKVQASSPEILRCDIKEEYQNDCFASPDKVEYVTTSSTNSPGVEYQFQPHDDSFSSCTSDVHTAHIQDYADNEPTLSEAKEYEDHDKYNSPIHEPQSESLSKAQNEPQSESLSKAQNELRHEILPPEVDLSTASLLPIPEILMCDKDIVATKSRAKLSKPQPIMCPCCDSIMSPTHNCEIDPLSDPNSDVPPTPPLLVPCPEELMHPPDTADGIKDFVFKDPDFGEMFNTYLNSESGSESCKTQ